MTKKKALICGVSGQDGSYLARFLLSKDYEVIGTSRDAQISKFINLKKLNISQEIKLESMAINDFRSVLQIIMNLEPDEIYNLAGQTSVGISFEQPVETLESISIGTLNLLEAIRFSGKRIKFYNAGSSECFGETNAEPAIESTSFRPQSPYAVAKAAAYWQVANYRNAYGLFASSGILFNHESPLRPERFVTKKIVAAACRIYQGSGERLVLGNLDIKRDWGWAPEYVEAMWRILQHDQPDDFIIATGETKSLKEFIELVFKKLNMNWFDHVDSDRKLFRSSDLKVSMGNPTKANEILKWKAEYKLNEIVEMMVDSELVALKKQTSITEQ